MKNIKKLLFVVTLLFVLITTPCAQSNQNNTSQNNSFSISVNGYSFNMKLVNRGTFLMGCTNEQGGDCESRERPTHQVILDSYYLGEYEVTVGLWKAVMGPITFLADENFPMYRISWEQAQDFIFKLNRLTGQKFRLPTEAEWEYAARGGNLSIGRKYSGAHSLDNCGWYKGNISLILHAVGGKNENELGLYDMSGNVWEWCQDWFGNYSGNRQINPTGPTSGSQRVLRGGAVSHDASFCRTTYRASALPDYRDWTGLRLACSTLTFISID